jgi:hypothetical protein
MVTTKASAPKDWRSKKGAKEKCDSYCAIHDTRPSTQSTFPLPLPMRNSMTTNESFFTHT